VSFIIELVCINKYNCKYKEEDIKILSEEEAFDVVCERLIEMYKNNIKDEEDKINSYMITKASQYILDKLNEKGNYIHISFKEIKDIETAESRIEVYEKTIDYIKQIAKDYRESKGS
jgi:hypothetical protein